MSGLSPSSGHVYLDREPVATCLRQRQEWGTQDRHILRAMKSPWGSGNLKTLSVWERAVKRQ